jgi:hypothetical protein
MAPCDEYQAQIVALFDNEARDEDLRLAAGHLRDCPDCRAFYMELVAIRRAGATAAIPSLSPGARQAVLDGIKADQAAPSGSYVKDRSGLLRFDRLGRWAAVLLIGVLSILSFGLSREARDLRTRLEAAEQRVAAIHKQAQLAESEERQQKAISALYFRMAELEERVNRGSPSQRASVPAQVYERAEKQSNL